MKGHGTDASPNTKEMQSSPGILLPNITSLMRNEFIPLMQCLEQGDDILFKTYNMELALALARFDALLKEEERRIFVCTFDALVRHLLKDLHHFVQVEGLLQQDVLLLSELADRCRMVEHLCCCYLRNGEASGGGSKGLRSISTCSATTRSPSFTGDGGAMADAKGQQETRESADTCRVSCSSCELRQFSLEMTCHLQSTSLTMPSVMPGGGGNLNDQPHSNTLRSTSTSQCTCHQTPLAGALSLGGKITRQAAWRCDELQELLAARLSKEDVTALVNMLQSQSRCFSTEKKQDGSNTYGGSLFQAAPKVIPHMHSKGGGGGGTNHNSNCNGSGVARHGTYMYSSESNITRRLMQSTEEIDSFVRGSGNSFMMDPSALNPSLTLAAGGRTANRTVLHLNMLVEGLIHGKGSVPTSPSSSFCSVEDTDQNSTMCTSSSENRRGVAVHTGEFTGRITMLASHEALVLLKTLFPSLRNYAKDFENFSEAPILVAAEESSGGLCAAPFLLTADTSVPVRHADVVVFSLLRSLQKMQNDANAPSSVTVNVRTGESVEKAGVSEDFMTTLPPQENNTAPSLPRRMADELESMVREVQEAIASAQAMQEQLREEFTLVLFRVISTAVDLLLPAVSCVDQRAVMFYRKWICDMYRLLWEEDLLGRFSTLSTAFMQQQSNENIPTGRVLPSLFSMCPSALCEGGRHNSAKEGSVHAGSKSMRIPILAGENTKMRTEEGVDERKDDTIWIAPGNVYSYSLRSLVGADDSINESVSVSMTSGSKGHALSSTPLANSTIASAATSTIVAPKDVSHTHEFENFDNPVVLAAESLLEDTSTELLSPHGFLVTRLMAALLNGLVSDKQRRFATTLERAMVTESAAVTSSSELQPSAIRRAVAAKGAIQLLMSKKNSSSVQSSPMKKVTQTVAPETSCGVFQQQYPRFRYPIVSTVADVKSLYCSALLEAEMVLSPLDPIRAALVQNTVDFLVSGMRERKEAYEVLDAYLDNVETEQIQPPSTRRPLLDIGEENANSGSSNPLTSADSPFSVTIVRRAKQMFSDSLTGGGKVHASHVNPGVRAKRCAGTMEKDESVAVLKLLAVPKVIPSWNSLEESEQFLLILALLRREYITLREAVDATPLSMRLPQKDGLN